MGNKSKTWRRVPIVDICERHVDCVNRTAPIVSEPTPFKMIRTTNVKNGFIDTLNVRYVTEEIYRKWTRRLVPRRGDIILTREAPLGDVGKVRTDDLIFLGQRLYHFRPDPRELDADFLLYALMADDLQGQIQGFGSGATVEHMRLSDIPNLKIYAPAIHEQKRIGRLLSAYDDLIENNTRRIAILEEMARRTYEDWFIHFRFPGHEKVKMVDSELGKIPEGWKINVLGKLASDIRQAVQPNMIDPETPYVGLEHIPRRSIALSEWGQASDVQSTKIVFQERDILFGKIRPYFHKVAVAPINGVTSSDSIVIRTVNEDFYALVLATVSSDAFVAHATQTSNGTKMPRANWNVLIQYSIAIPPKPLLSQFNSFITDIVAATKNFTLRNRNLRATRDFLLPKLISGEIDVSKLPEPEEAAA